LEENGALIHRHVAGAIGETENRVRAKPGNGAIIKNQFGTGLIAGQDSSITPDSFVDFRGAGLLAANHIHFVLDARDFRLSQSGR
jgi:hypothetical protein